MTPRSTQEKVLIALSAFGFASIFPFSIIRFIRAEWTIAVIDLVISGIMLGICLYVVKTRRVKITSFLLAIISLSGAIASVYMKGQTQIYWVYPAILASHYLIPPRQALILSIPTSIIATGLVYDQISSLSLTAIIATQMITNLFAYVFSNSMHAKQRLLAELANKDSLTKVGNRRALDIKLNQAVQAQGRTPSTICLIIFDLDHFKAINDEFGHRVGDSILVDLVNIVGSRIRETDSLYRFGGEEFVIVPLPISLDDAINFAEELRLLVSKSKFQNHIQLTISLGVAKYRQGESYSDWLDRADKALYQAKKAGRNQSCIAEENIAA